MSRQPETWEIERTSAWYKRDAVVIQGRVVKNGREVFLEISRAELQAMVDFLAALPGEEAKMLGRRAKPETEA